MLCSYCASQRNAHIHSTFPQWILSHHCSPPPCLLSQWMPPKSLLIFTLELSKFFHCHILFMVFKKLLMSAPSTSRPTLLPHRHNFLHSLSSDPLKSHTVTHSGYSFLQAQFKVWCIISSQCFCRAPGVGHSIVNDSKIIQTLAFQENQ